MSGRQGHAPVPAPAPAPVVDAAPDRSRLPLAMRLPVFVATSGLLGLAAHTSATGTLPGPAAIVLGVLAVTALGMLHRRREARFESLTLLVVSAQAVLHVVLCVSGGPGASGAGHHADLMAGLDPGHPMLLAHVLAAGVAGWWLAHGEAAAWAAARRVLPEVPPAAPSPVVVVRVAPPAAAPVVLHDQIRGLRQRPRRGPPALAV